MNVNDFKHMEMVEEGLDPFENEPEPDGSPEENRNPGLK